MIKKAYEVVVDRFLQLIEAETLPSWQRSWTSGVPRNLISRKMYRGFNLLFLGIMQIAMEYKYPYWLTFRQAQSLGGNVKKGEKGVPIIFWKWLQILNDEGEIEKKIPYLRYYTVFNISQTTVNPPKEAFPETEKEANRKAVRKAALIVKKMKNRPLIKTGNLIENFSYSPSTDTVNVVPIRRMKSEAEWWTGLFHELTHSTGHQKRLGRKTLHPSGQKEKAIEELTAEIGAVFLVNICGFSSYSKVEKNSAAYLKNWTKYLRKRKRDIIIASSMAQKAVDYITGGKNGRLFNKNFCRSTEKRGRK